MRDNRRLMDPSTVFAICNNGVLPAWLLLAVAPRWRWTGLLVHAVWIPGLLALVYVWALVSAPPLPEGAGFGSLEAVMRGFSVPHVAVAGWVHYLAFDLFVGAWECRDAARRGISHLWVIPCLLLTLLLGPVGLALYLIVRFALTRELSLDGSLGGEVR
jgi:hypothetical protein